MLTSFASPQSVGLGTGLDLSAMRAKTVKDRRTGAQTLTIHTTRGESLDLGQAQWLAEGHWYMLPFRFESNGAEILFYYDVTHCETMHGVLRSVVPGGQYVGILVAVLSVMEQCEEHRVPLSYVQWDPKSVYISAQGYPLFVVVPALGLEPDRNTATTLLQTLADARRTRLEDAVVQGYQRALAEFLGRNSLVNADALHDFMAYLLPGTVQPRQAQSAQSTHEDNGSETQFGATVVSDGTMVGATRFGATVLSSKPKLQTTPQQSAAPVTAAATSASATPSAHVAPVTSTTRGAHAAQSASATSAQSAPTTPAQPTPVTLAAPVVQPAPAMPPRKQEAQLARENPVREQYISENPTLDNRGATPDVLTNAVSGVTATAAAVAGGATTAAVGETNAATAAHGANTVNNIDAVRVPITSSIARPIIPVSAVNSALHADENDSEGETMLRLYTDKSRGFTVTRLRDGKAITVHATRATIGRSKTADIHMGGNTNVSRIHAVIDMLDDGRFCITDNHSANGTAVGGRELASGGCEYVASGGDFTLADDTFVISPTIEGREEPKR